MGPTRPAPNLAVSGSTDVTEVPATTVAAPSAPFPTPPSGPGLYVPQVGPVEQDNIQLADREMVGALAVFVLMLVFLVVSGWRAGVLCALPALLVTAHALRSFWRHASGQSATAQGSRGFGCALLLGVVFLSATLLGLVSLFLMCLTLTG
jgi:hypothetical protein